MNEAGKARIIRGLSLRERWSRITFLVLVLIVIAIGAICVSNAVKWIDKPFHGFLFNKRLVIGGVGEYSWTGTQAGLKFPDKIVKANNKTVSSVSDLEDVIINTNVGTIINYSVKRGDQVIEVAIPTMNFVLKDFLVIFGVYFFVGVAYLSIGVVVFVLKPDSKVSWAFLLLCLFLSAYNLAGFDITASPHIFTRIYFLLNTFMPAAAIHLSMIFPERKRFVERHPYLQYVPYIIAMIIVTPLEVFYPGPLFLMMYQLVFIYMVLSVIAFLTSIISSFYKKTSTLARQRAKVILFGAALAFPLPVIAMLLSFMGKSFLGVQIQNNFLTIPILCFPVAIAYSIAKHNLFDVDVFIKRTLGYVITTVVIGSAFLLMHVLVDIFVHHQLAGDHHGAAHHESAEGDASGHHELAKRVVSGQFGLADGHGPAHHELATEVASEHHGLTTDDATAHHGSVDGHEPAHHEQADSVAPVRHEPVTEHVSGYHGSAEGVAHHRKSVWSKLNIADKIVPVLSALLIVFCFNPFHHSVQHLVDKLFYRKKYDYKETITSISHELNSMLNEDAIIKRLVSTVRKKMFVDAVGVILLEPESKTLQTFFMDDQTVKEEEQIKEMNIAYDDPLLVLLSKEKKMITKYDIAEDPRYLYVKESCGNRFMEMESSLAMPLIYNNQVKGVFSVGHKKSGHFFTREDIDLLNTLANHGIVAIENAKLFEENLEKVRMEEELKIGHDIQMSMMPDKAPEIEGFKIAASSIPAREVGGDFYDFVGIGDGGERGSQAVVVGDVSGKGVSAGLLMAASRSTYRALAADNHPVEQVMAIGNQRLNCDIKEGMFVAILYAVLTPGERVLTFSNAGQTQPILCTEGDAGPCFIDTEGDKFPQGIVPDCQYLEKQVALKEGNTVILYTDGVVEAMNDKDELYGFDRFMVSIDEGKGLDADPLLEKLMNDVTRFTGGAKQHDDITVIVIKVV